MCTTNDGGLKKGANQVKELKALFCSLKENDIGVYINSAGDIALCSLEEKVSEQQLWESPFGAQLKQFSAKAIKGYLKHEYKMHKLGNRMTIGFTLYECATDPTKPRMTRLGKPDADGDSIKVSASLEHEWWNYGVKIIVSPDTNKDSLLRVLRKVISSIEMTNEYDELRGFLIDKDEQYCSGGEEQQKLKGFLESGTSITELNEITGKTLKLKGGNLVPSCEFTLSADRPAAPVI